MLFPTLYSNLEFLISFFYKVLSFMNYLSYFLMESSSTHVILCLKLFFVMLNSRNPQFSTICLNKKNKNGPFFTVVSKWHLNFGYVYHFEEQFLHDYENLFQNTCNLGLVNVFLHKKVRKFAELN